MQIVATYDPEGTTLVSVAWLTVTLIRKCFGDTP